MVILSDRKALALDTALAGFILAEQVESDVVDQGDIPGCMTGSFAALIFMKLHLRGLDPEAPRPEIQRASPKNDDVSKQTIPAGQ